MIITHISDQGIGVLNEDVVLLADPIFGVLDGVTSFDKYTDPDGRTGGLIAASLTRDIFTNTKASLADSALRANTKIENAMKARGIQTAQMESRWGTAAAVIRLHAETVEWLRIADCSIHFLSDNGRVTTIAEDAAIHKDSLRACVQYAKNRTPKYWDKLLPMLKQNRYRANQDFGVLNGDPRVQSFIKTGKVPRSALRAVLLHSDGFAYPKTDPDSPENPTQLMKSVLTQGLSAVANKIRAIENSDPECWKYPRFKKSDDLAAVLIRF